MKVKKIDLSIERSIIIYMITSSQFLREIAQAVKPDQFESFYAQTVSSWILEYWEQFKEPPGKHIQDIYAQKQRSIRDEDQLETISDFLRSISQEYEKTERVNIEYLLEQSISYLKIRSLKITQEKLEKAILDKDHVKGEQVLANYRRVGTVRGKGVALLTDAGPVSDAFILEDDLMFKFSGALGEVIGYFTRGDLVSYLAAAKKGKSWWQWYTIQQAAARGYKSVIFNLEIVENQYIRRAWQSMVGAPKRSGVIKIPYFEEIENEKKTSSQNLMWTVRLRSENREQVNAGLIKKQQKSLKRQFRSGDIRIITLPANSATIGDLEAHLDNLLYYDNFIPDAIGVDSADLIVPEKKYGVEKRHQLNGIWTNLRRIAQERKALLVTASHAGRKAFKKDADETDIVEDISKIGHVGKMISLNQSPEDRRRRIIRVKSLAERDEFCSVDTALVLQCLDIGKVCMDSRLAKDVDVEYEEDADE